jgi:hypothetical protein
MCKDCFNNYINLPTFYNYLYWYTISGNYTLTNRYLYPTILNKHKIVQLSTKDSRELIAILFNKFSKGIINIICDYDCEIKRLDLNTFLVLNKFVYVRRNISIIRGSKKKRYYKYSKFLK